MRLVSFAVCLVSVVHISCALPITDEGNGEVRPAASRRGVEVDGEFVDYFMYKLFVINKKDLQPGSPE